MAFGANSVPWLRKWERRIELDINIQPTAAAIPD